jgi:hypothetical protein
MSKDTCYIFLEYYDDMWKLQFTATLVNFSLNTFNQDVVNFSLNTFNQDVVDKLR